MPGAIDVDIIVEGSRTLALLAAVAVLVHRGRTHLLQGRVGWALIVAGLTLLALVSGIDLLDEFAVYDALPVALAYPAWGVLDLFTEFLGPVVGAALLLIGFLLWLPMPARLSLLEAELRSANRQLQARIVSTENAWQTLLANAPDYVLLVDEELKVAYANRTPSGLRLGDVIGQPVVGFVPDPADQSALLAALREALLGGAPATVELSGAGPEGRQARYVCRVAPSFTADGSRAALMINVDVTERRAAEARRASAEERYRLASQATRDVLYDYDLVGETLVWGDSMESTFGHRLADLGDRLSGWADRIHPDDQAGVLRSFRDALAGRSTSWQAEYRFACSDGSWANVLDRAAVVRDPSGAARRVVGAMTDMTRLHSSERALRLSEERMRSMLDNLDEAFISTGLSPGSEALLSRGVERIFGVPLERFRSQSWVDYIHPDDRPRAMAVYARMLRGENTDNEVRLLRPDGTVRWIHSSMRPVKGPDGTVDRLDGTIRDITAEREAAEHGREVQRLQTVSAMKSEFLNAAAHELSTPLTPIKLHVASLREAAFGPLSAEQRDALDLVDRNLDRLALLVTDVLDAARLQSGRLRMTMHPVAISPLLKDVFNSFSAKAASEGIGLASHGLEDSAHVRADEARLGQVCFNLVHNALKFTPRGGQVGLEMRREGAEAVLAVSDNGKGMTEAQLARLFQPFSQVHDLARHDVGGTGLGLYISKGLVEQMGGTIHASSDGPGRGSRFEVRLPLAPASPPRASTAPASSPRLA